VGGAYTYIQTLHGVGYRFLCTPRRMPGAALADNGHAGGPMQRPAPPGLRGAPAG
jgi:hypothetical protein